MKATTRPQPNQFRKSASPTARRLLSAVIPAKNAAGLKLTPAPAGTYARVITADGITTAYVIPGLTSLRLDLHPVANDVTLPPVLTPYFRPSGSHTRPQLCLRSATATPAILKAARDFLAATAATYDA